LTLEERCQNQDKVTFNFLNEAIAYFLLHIIVAYLKRFSIKHNNKIFFLLSTFQIIRLESYSIAGISIIQDIRPTAKIS